MRRYKKNVNIEDLWLDEFLDKEKHLCGLCGNTGKIDTRGKVKSPVGIVTGVLAFCICPNGRVMKKIFGKSRCE
jgi:hypothetical protein